MVPNVSNTISTSCNSSSNHLTFLQHLGEWRRLLTAGGNWPGVCSSLKTQPVWRGSTSEDSTQSALTLELGSWTLEWRMGFSPLLLPCLYGPPLTSLTVLVHLSLVLMLHLKCFCSKHSVLLLMCLRSDGLSLKWSMLDPAFHQWWDCRSCIMSLPPFYHPAVLQVLWGGRLPVYERPRFSSLSIKLIKKNRPSSSTRRERVSESGEALEAQGNSCFE